MTKLSDHFTLAEAAKSQIAVRKDINNRPPAALIPGLMRVATQILEPVRRHYRVPFSPSSWYRSPVLNAAVGSKPTSQHLSGRAVDFEVPGVANIDVARWCAHNLTFDQLILEFYTDDDPASGWVHCSISMDNRARGEILTVTNGGVSPGLPL